MRRARSVEHRRSTVTVDGVPVWEAGRIRLEAVPGAAAVLERHPGLADLFARPDQRIGLGMEDF